MQAIDIYIKELMVLRFSNIKDWGGILGICMIKNSDCL